MKLENTVGFRLSLYDVGKPQDLEAELQPVKLKARKWIPQTLGEQIWVWYEFHTPEEKEAYLAWLKASDISTISPWNQAVCYAKDMLMGLDQKQLDYWAK